MPTKNKQAWTPEPFHLVSDGDAQKCYPAILMSDNGMVRVSVDSGRNFGDPLPTAKRIAACYEASAGIEDPSAIKELIEAAKLAFEVLRAKGENQIAEHCEAALAKLEGK